MLKKRRLQEAPPSTPAARLTRWLHLAVASLFPASRFGLLSCFSQAFRPSISDYLSASTSCALLDFTNWEDWRKNCTFLTWSVGDGGRWPQPHPKPSEAQCLRASAGRAASQRMLPVRRWGLGGKHGQPGVLWLGHCTASFLTAVSSSGDSSVVSPARQLPFRAALPAASGNRHLPDAHTAQGP
ncbi:hypothetical protein MTO96_048666 [Rhipicephalus appendiculatus]